MALETQKIKEILLRENYVTKEDLQKAEEYAKTRNIDILDYLISEQTITKDLLGQAISESYGIPYADLNSTQPAKDQVLKIPEEIAKRNRLVVFRISDASIILTTDNPEQPYLTDADILILKNIFHGKDIKLQYSLMEDIDIALLNFSKALDTRFKKIIEEGKMIAPELIHEIVSDALNFRASDIHFDPQEKETIIRFRVDGLLYEAGRLTKDLYDNILNRIKVQAHLRTDEHFSAQDGAIRYQQDEQHFVDMRISIAPVLDGEKIVIRLLAEYVRSFALADLGLSKTHQSKIIEYSKKPYGMILVAGPTGSGKTTTLYALLKMLNSPEVNIATIEDPVEYKIVGVNHIQVNPQTNLTFAKGLKSIVRQDPDIIFVGEIRDHETAEIAVNAALTGHLLLSSFHANDAATAVPRLLDLGVEPFLLSSTLQLVIAQRLVRRICEKCRYSVSYSQQDLARLSPVLPRFFTQPSITLYKGKGCPSCSQTGFKGRTAIFEFIEATKEMQDLMLKNPSSRQIWELARKQGAKSLFEDGLEKVKSGITTLEELLRIAAPPEL